MPGLHKVLLTLPPSNVGDVYVARRARGTDMEARVQATPAQKPEFPIYTRKRIITSDSG